MYVEHWNVVIIGLPAPPIPWAATALRFQLVRTYMYLRVCVYACMHATPHRVYSPTGLSSISSIILLRVLKSPLSHGHFINII